jgi:hypothetical protein
LCVSGGGGYARVCVCVRACGCMCARALACACVRVLHYLKINLHPYNPSFIMS